MADRTVSASVVVCGGGVSGALCAIAAARDGADVLLIERGGCLGGTLTASLIGIILDGQNKEGLVGEWQEQIRAAMARGGCVIEECEKVLLEALCRDAGVRVLYYAMVTGCTVENRQIRALTVHTNDGAFTVTAEVYVDATGNGSLAAMAGCSYDMGNADGIPQPMSMVALVGGAPERYIGWNNKEAFGALLQKIGVRTSLGFPNLTAVGDGYCTLGINHEYGYACTDAFGISEAVCHARREICDTVAALRRTPEFSRFTLLSTPELIGIREGRRIHCRYTVTLDDVLEGRRHDDAICRVTYWVDVHALDDRGDRSYTGKELRCQPYDVPLRALLPVDIDNLLVTGRAIGGDFHAHASYRVAGNCAAFGEAAGKLAARRVKNK